MGPGVTNGAETGSAIGDIAYLARSAHRVSTLVALTDQPRSRPEVALMEPCLDALSGLIDTGGVV